VIDEMVMNLERRSVNGHQRTPVRRSMQNVMAKKRMGSVMLYTMGALVLAVFSSIVFNFLGSDTAFAISIMGSLIGGFLGALLAAALIVDIYTPTTDERQD